MFSSSDEVYDVSISWHYIHLRVTYNFGLGKWAKIERKNGKLLCVKTSLVDWCVYTWAQSVSKTIRQNRMGFSYIISWSCQVWLLSPPFFLNVLTSSCPIYLLTGHGLRRVYVGTGPLFCIINLLIASVGNVLMRLGFQGKGTEDCSRQWLFSNLETIIVRP